MFILSDLLRYTVSDGEQRAKLSDFRVDPTAGDNPPVTGVLWRDRRAGLLSLSWDAVRGMDRRAREIRVESLAAGAVLSPDDLARAVLLKRDILDAMVLDLQSRRATRLNDLWLSLDDGRLRLDEADLGSLAILRRVTRGHLARRSHDRVPWKYIEFLRGAPQEALDAGDYHERIARLPPGEIVQLLQALPYLHATEMIALLPECVAAKTVEAMPPERQVQVFEELPQERGARLLSRMRPDLAADLVGYLAPDVAETYLGRLEDDARARIVALLRYPENTAGGIMTNDIVITLADLTIEQIDDNLRQRLKEPDFVNFIYLVDDGATGRLQGVVSLREIVTARPTERLRDLMNPYLITVYALDPADVAARRVIDSQLVALPVIDQEGRIVGAITVDAAIARVAPGAWRAEAPKVFA
ncbi:MAG: CBS domain-containing protein [Anaerolineae bacterium]